MTKNNMTHEQDTRSALEHFTMDFSAIQMTLLLLLNKATWPDDKQSHVA